MTQVLTPKPLAKIVFKDGKIFRQTDNDLYTGWEQIYGYELVDPNKMRFMWKGGLIPWTLWVEVCCFLRWTQATHHCEALMTFFYNKKEKTWKVWPFSQHPVGMTIKYETTHTLYAEDRKQFGNDWMQMGSIHHHCNSAAFQSTTDKSDEEDRDGVHFTLGNMNDRKMTIDIRQVFDGVQSEPNITHWLEMPNFAKNCGEDLMYEVFGKSVAYAGLEGASFPPEWKDRIIEKKSTHHHLTPGETHHLPGFRDGSAGGSAGHGSTRPTAPEVGRSWREGRKIVIQDVLDTLGISSTKAYVLMCEDDWRKLSHEELMLKRKIGDLLEEKLCPPAWSLSLLDEMSTDEMAEAEANAAIAEASLGV